MKNKIMITLVAAVLWTSVSFASPVVDVQQGEVVAGYNYSRLSVDGTYEGTTYDVGRAGMSNFYAQTGIRKNWMLAVEHSSASPHWTDGIDTFSLRYKSLDVTLQYDVAKNIRFIVGNRYYDISGTFNDESVSEKVNKFIYGIAAKTKLGQDMEGYAKFIKTSYETEYKAGVVYNFSKQSFLDVNYSHHKYDYLDATVNTKGFGAGLGFRF